MLRAPRCIRLVLGSAILVGLMGAAPSAAGAQADAVSREYVRLRAQTFGLLYSPSVLGPESSVGLILMHPNSDFLNHVGCAEMAKRGYRVLCINGLGC